MGSCWLLRGGLAYPVVMGSSLVVRGSCVGPLLALAWVVACRVEGSTEPPGGTEAMEPHPVPSRPEAVTADAEPAATQPAASVPAPVHAFAWGNTTGDWNSAVAVAASGWVLSAGGGMLRVHASDDGRVLESARVCYPANNGLALLSETRGVVVCKSGEIKALTLPGLKHETVATVGGDGVSLVGWGGGLLATGDRKSEVHVLDTATWKENDAFTVPHEIEGVAVAPDGRWVAVGDREGGTSIREQASKSTRELVRTDRRPTAMAAAPDGGRLFVQDGSFEARIYDVASGAVIESYECGSWLTGARWLGPDTIAATGSDGFVLYTKGAAKARALLDPDAARHASYEWLGASPDGEIVCGGDRGGRVSCFSTQPMPASTYEPAPVVAGAPDPGKAAGAEAEAAPLLEGTIVSHEGKRLEVTATSATLPAVGTKGSLSRRFERTLGRMTMSGWMGIAKVEVMKVSGPKVVLKILEETSNVKINGRKQDQFARGFEVKLEPSE